jgi:hypothetical protein
MGEIDRVLKNVDLLGQSGGDVDCGVGNDQWLGMTGNIHYETVAEPAGGAQAAVTFHHFGHEFVGMEAALHQSLGLALAHELDRAFCGSVAVLGRHNREIRDVDSELGRYLPDTAWRPDEDWLDQAEARCIHCPFERALITRMDHCCQ